MINWGRWVSQPDAGRAAICGTGELTAFVDRNVRDLTHEEVLVRKPWRQPVPGAQPRRHRCGSSFHQRVSPGGQGPCSPLDARDLDECLLSNGVKGHGGDEPSGQGLEEQLEHPSGPTSKLGTPRTGARGWGREGRVALSGGDRPAGERPMSGGATAI